MKAHFLELFSFYIIEKVSVFDLKHEKAPRCGLSKTDRRLAELPFKDLQETM